MTREDIRKALTDEQALTLTLLGEAAGESLAGQVAVGCVIRNRMLEQTWFGKTIASVCLRDSQFSCWWEATVNSDRLYETAEALLQQTVPPVNPAILAELAWVAQGILSGALRDRTNQANHYLTTALLESTHAPGWARAKSPVAVIDHHTFFRL